MKKQPAVSFAVIVAIAVAIWVAQRQSLERPVPPTPATAASPAGR